MRNDTKRLLDRLGQPEFQYREYDDTPTTSTERWPLFELIERQLKPVITRAPEQSAPEPEFESAAIPENNIQTLMARLAKGRVA